MAAGRTRTSRTTAVPVAAILILHLMPTRVSFLRRPAAILVFGVTIFSGSAGFTADAWAQTVAPAPQTAPPSATSSSLETPSSNPSNLIVAAAQDFTRLVSRDSAVLLTIGGVAAALGHSVDRPVSSGMSNARWLDDAFDPGETIGGARMQAAGAVATYALGHLTSNATVTTIGADLIRAQIVTQTLTTAIKAAAQRTRPDGTQYSFPSGHSAVTFASATVLQRNLGWKVGIPAYGVAAYVAASRVQVRRHFLSDVAFGAAIGIAAGRTVTVGRGDYKFSLEPAAVPGGAALTFGWNARH